LGTFSKSILGISLKEATVARRGFRTRDPLVCQRLETIGKTFLFGYHAALKEDDISNLGNRLDAVEPELKGFAFEGAAMGVALLDGMPLGKRDRWLRLIDGVGSAHVYMLHVGFGWAIARLPWLRRRVVRAIEALDPLLRWLAVDGLGFHEGYFHWRKYVRRRVNPRGLSGYALRVFDQGLGRSLWFVDGADVLRIAATIDTFPNERHSDLWSGVGLACAYAGGVDRSEVDSLRKASGPHLLCVAQGAAFAAKARERASNPAEHTDLACRVLCGVSAQLAALETDAALEGLPMSGPEPPYEIWRNRIQSRLAELGAREATLC